MPGPSEIVPVHDWSVEKPEADSENTTGEEVKVATGTGVTGTMGTGVTTPNVQPMPLAV